MDDRHATPRGSPRPPAGRADFAPRPRAGIAIRLLWLMVFLPGVTDAGDVRWLAAWHHTEPMQTARAGAAVVVKDDFIYVIGGVDGKDFLASVERARFRPGGGLSPWQAAATLNEPRGFLDAVEHNGFIYAVGGGNGPNGKHLLRSVERARILPDGTLTPWQVEPQVLALPRRCVKLAVAGDRLYAFGGFGGALLDSVETARIRADGSLGPWRIEPETMTLPRYVNAVKGIAGRFYVLGGHQEREGLGLTAVEWSQPDGDRRLQAWQATAALVQGRYALAAVADRDRIYALGGLDGAIYTDTIERAAINTDGLDPWRRTTPLSSPRANFGAATHDHRLYVIGGTNRDGYYRSVEFAEINVEGDLGIWADAATFEALQARQRAAASPRDPLPNLGRVLETIHTRAYTYLRVASEHGETWIAAPRIELELGDTVRYSRGVTMEHFHSNTLQRDFPAILFVEGLERAPH